MLFTLLIEDPRYFNIPPDKTSSIVGNATIASSLASIATSQLAGILYDLVGRRALLSLGILFGGVTMVLVPFCSNVMPQMFIVKMLLMNFGTVTVLHPLLIDYVSQESKGLAAGISSVFGGLSKILLLSVELPLTSSLPIYYNFSLNGALCIVFSALICFAISDVYYKEEKVHLPCCQ